MTDTSNLPESARILVDHLGATLALKLIKAWPGLKFRVPLGARDDAPMRERLVVLLGDDGAQRLMDQFGGETIYVATCAQAVRDVRDTIIIADYTAGVDGDQLALREKLSRRQIDNILKRTPGGQSPITHRAKPVDENQLDMFPGR